MPTYPRPKTLMCTISYLGMVERKLFPRRALDADVVTSPQRTLDGSSCHLCAPGPPDHPRRGGQTVAALADRLGVIGSQVSLEYRRDISEYVG